MIVVFGLRRRAEKKAAEAVRKDRDRREREQLARRQETLLARLRAYELEASVLARRGGAST